MVMKLNAKFFALFLGLFCLAPFSYAVDTLEVYAILVQFAQEKPDNSLTTGDGTFNCDKKNTDSYKLDPVKNRNQPYYWKKHFEFANNYFRAASGGKLAIRSRIFPEPSSGKFVYTLKKQIIDYNRTSRMEGEKTAEFDLARSQDYLQFVYDAVMAAHSDESGESPFNIPLSENPNVKRAYMIIHAGASGLVDGGSMGTRGADTPGDFVDAYVKRDFWCFLDTTLDYVALKKVPKNDKNDKDSLVATGLVLKNATIDTLRTMMVLSETASQDGLNWGVNGILVNQIARELGLPNTFDDAKGISRLGYFDVMDFAGYNAGNGFLPALPAAWERAYMGWSQMKEVHPVAGKPITVDVATAGTGKGVEIVKVPLSASEYLLIENRQRSWNENGEVNLVTSEADDGSDSIVKSFPVDSLNLIFDDEVCVKSNCKKNKKKPSGIILNVSSFDAGIPASGIVVWRVNEWYLRETLPYGIANIWGGDTLRDHQFGISLVEADGILSIGKTFKNMLGEETYDFGSGTDLLPHLRKPAKDSKQTFDTVKTIMPTGYANTKTTQGGYTGIKISVAVPKNARSEKTSNAFMGDSVVNFGAPVIRVTISIDDGSIEGSKFPRNVGLTSAVRGAVFVDNPEKDGEKIVVVGAEDGTLQAFTALGDTLFDADTVIVQKTLSRNAAEKNIPLYRVGAGNGPLVGLASDGKDVYSLHRDKLVKTSFSSGIPTQDEIAVDSATAGPIAVQGYSWFASKGKLWRNGQWQKLPEDFVAHDMAYCGDPSKERQLEKRGNNEVWVPNGNEFVLVGDEGRLVFVADDFHSKAGNELTAPWSSRTTNLGKQHFRISCTDLDRDGVEEVIVLGSRGTVAAYKNTDSKLQNLWTKSYKRGSAEKNCIKDSTCLNDETSGMAIGDVNNDGYPEVVFLGNNMVYAIDRSGLPVSGFPVKISRGSPIFGFFSDPVIVDVNGDESPEILVPSNDGLVYAYTGKGKALTASEGFPLAAGSYEDASSVKELQPMSIFVANAVSDKKSAGPELYALHRDNLSAFRLRKASVDAASANAAWTLPAGGNERTGYFDASKLSDVKKETAKDEISEFFIFPNPVRGGVAKARFEVGNDAKNATLELYDITGLCVFKTKMSDVKRGRNQLENLDLKHLGSDVYTARLKVKFESGKTKQKLYRVGVVK